jgi:hypothetical protein
MPGAPRFKTYHLITVKSTGNPLNTTDSPQTFGNHALTEEEVAQLCDAMLYDEMMSTTTLQNQSYLAPDGNEGSSEGASGGDWNLPYDSTALRPTRIMTIAPDGQQRYEFICIHCGTRYDRMGRARDCRNQDLGLTPYQCGGRCGDMEWSASLSSSFGWSTHLSW